ncbi:MAG: hypothetical protein BWY13_01337 [Euryarchaeota archaeon ADurb.Bin190]|nr:MAG: hypothetical protein BWY13_01337 [Euryarchaeota archaeon ADurb.Bin190]
MVMHQTALVDEGVVGQGQAGQIYGKKAIASQNGGDGVGDKHQGYGQNGIKPLVIQADAIDEVGHASA